MPICKKYIKSVKDRTVDLKQKINTESFDKRNLLWTHEDEDNFLIYHFRKYNENKNSANKKGYLAYQKLSRLNTKIRKLSDKLKDTYVINFAIDHPQCAEPPNPIIKCANFNIIPIKNCTSVYQMKLCTVRSALIISRRTKHF